ncbi:hypothetical protein LUZ60_014787 [Juncus effusus]|nr:hypothetical protein LUZ60_014787 [Juncus effusus]
MISDYSDQILTSSSFLFSQHPNMGENKVSIKKWDEMETDVLVKIFKLLNMVELGPASQVCKLWRVACSDPIIWSTLDLTRLESNFIQTRASPYIWVDERSDKRLARILKLTMSLSQESVTCLIFHYNLYMKDEHLSIISQRCPNLKHLIMPAWNRITKSGICAAIRRWPNLQSLTMPTIAHPPYILQEISRSCPNFQELKIMGTFDLLFASSIISHLPHLKVLSLRCSRVMKDALIVLLTSVQDLECLNISHCLILEMVGRKHEVRELDERVFKAGGFLKRFLVCEGKRKDGGCVMCERMVVDEGLMRWYRYEEDAWRYDEVASLDLGRGCGGLFDRECERFTAF